VRRAHKQIDVDIFFFVDWRCALRCASHLHVSDRPRGGRRGEGGRGGGQSNNTLKIESHIFTPGPRAQICLERHKKKNNKQ
jgi:hypothetical protein